jgi:hypothetical protein
VPSSLCCGLTCVVFVPCRPLPTSSLCCATYSAKVVNAGGTSATSIGITENPTPHSSTFPRTSLDPTVRTSQDETFSRLLSELSTANSSKIRAALFQSLLVPMPFITCEQLAHVFRYLELPSEKIQVARLVRGMYKQPLRRTRYPWPADSPSGRTYTCVCAMRVMLTAGHCVWVFRKNRRPRERLEVAAPPSLKWHCGFVQWCHVYPAPMSLSTPFQLLLKSLLFPTRRVCIKM